MKAFGHLKCSIFKFSIHQPLFNVRIQIEGKELSWEFNFKKYRNGNISWIGKRRNDALEIAIFKSKGRFIATTSIFNSNSEPESV